MKAARLLPSLAGLGLCAGLVLSTGCASPCQKVQDSHDAFRRLNAPASVRGEQGPRRVSGAHLSLSVPYELVDSLISAELGRVPTVKVPLPAVAGQSLGSLRLGVESVRTRQAPKGELGFRVIVGLRDGKKPVLSVNVDARVRPRLDPGAGSLSVALSGRDLIELEPSLDERGKAQLGDWIWSQIPGPARMLVDRATVTQLAGDLGDQLMKQAGSLLQRELLDDLGELARFELDLPEELPISAISLDAGERYLDIDLVTPLSVPEALPQTRGRVESLHPNLVQVRLSGDALAALANHAVREGRLPGRWTLEGEPDPQGEVHVGVGWAEGEADPLEILLWKLEGDCAHVILRAEPQIGVQQAEGRRELVLGARQAKVDSVIGSAKIRAGLFFSKTARRGISLIERTTAQTEVEIGRETMALEVHVARVEGDELVLGLRLVPRAPRG